MLTFHGKGKEKGDMYKVIIVAIGLIIGNHCLAYNPKLEKKIKKELNSVFSDCDLRKCELVLTPSNPEHHETEIYQINDEIENVIGYFAVTQGDGRFEKFDFLVIYNHLKQIQKVKVLLYRSTYGYEIGSRRWLEQFSNQNVEHEFKLNVDIQAISGATVSAKGITNEINRLNEIIKDI